MELPAPASGFIAGIGRIPGGFNQEIFRRKAPETMHPRPRQTHLLVPALLLLFLIPVAAAGQEEPDPCSTGQDLYHQAKFDAARTALMQCLEQNGDQVKVLLPLVVMDLQQDRLEEGAGLGARAVKADPNDPEARYWYGRVLLRQGKEDQARAQWEHGMQLSANHKGILEGLARLAIKDGKPAQAYNLLNQIRQQGVDEPWLHRLLGDLAAGKGMWDQALEHLQAAMAQEGTNTADLLSASQLSIMAGKPDQAVGFCRQAVQIEPGEATFGGLGEAYFATENLDSALVYLRLAVASPDPDPRFVFNLANACEVAGLYTEAEDNFENFLKLQPEDAVGHFNYGIHLNKQGRTAEGIGHVERALALDPSMLNARVVLAQMKEASGDYAGALEQVEMLQDKDKDNAADLATWHQRLVDEQQEASSLRAEGKVHLLHMLLGTREIVDKVMAELATGGDFGSLAVRFSTGPAASRGGDIGWIDPRQMKAPLRDAILKLGPNETSPPVQSGGLYHLFKRVP